MNDTTITHTPGPWRVECTGGFGEDGQPVAGVWVQSDPFTSIASLIPHHGVRGNAFLIAAAPDLLAAARALLFAADAFCDDTAHYWEVRRREIEALRAAVAKAEGRTA